MIIMVGSVGVCGWFRVVVLLVCCLMVLIIFMLVSWE